MERIGRLGAWAVAGTGVAVLLGWYFGLHRLTTVAPGFASMKPNTALCLVALGLAIPRMGRGRGAVLAGVGVGALGAATVLEYATGRGLGIDMLAPGLDLGTESSRMAQATAAAMLLLGGALVAGGLGRPTIMRVAAMGSFAVGYLAVLGYLYGVSSLYRVGGYTSMAVHTAVCVCLLSAAALLRDPDRGLVGLLRDKGSAGQLMRPMVPFLLIGPAALGGLRLWGQSRGWYDTRFGVAIQVMSMTMIGGAVNWWSAMRLRESDRQRDRARADLVGAHKLHAAEERFGMLLEAAPDAMLGVDADGVIRFANAQAELLLGYPRDELLGAEVEILVPDRARAAHTGHRAHYFADPKARPMAAGIDLSCRRKDGSEFPAEISLSSIESEDGVLVTAAVRDVSERVAAAAAIAAARDVAENAARSRQEFLANMSHEIRTPMNAVIGMTSLLLDTELDVRQRDYLETVRASGEHLLTIINDILDYAKIDAGKLVLEELPFAVRDWVQETLDLVTVEAHDKGLEIIYDVSPDVPGTLVGDPARLRQVLINLLSNAVKFTAVGEILVRLSLDQVALDGIWLRLEVIDSGVGIAPERIEALFDPFTQADSSTTRTYGGTGLGLAICRQLAERMGGSLTLASVPGVGTTATFVWHVAEYRTLDDQGSAGTPASPLAGRRMIAVDDNLANRQILTAWGERNGMDVVTADSAAQALHRIEREPALAFGIVDLMMPGMDGAQLGELLKARLPTMHLILLSSAGPYAHEIAKRGTFDAVLSKPVREEKLFELMATLLRSGPPLEKVAVPAPLSAFDMPADHQPLSILVVEDNPVNQKVAQHLLARFGFRADVAAGGCEALAALEHRAYDLILMDVQMPDMDGLEATRLIRSRWPDRPVQIVAMTANVASEDVRRAHEAGMDGFLGKPLDVEKLGRLLRGASAPQARPQQPAAADAGLGVIDTAVVARLCGLIGADAVRQIADLFFTGLEEAIPDLVEGCRGRDRVLLSRTAHRLKSSAHNLGAQDLGVLLDELEREAAEAAWPRLGDLVARVQAQRVPIHDQLLAQLEHPE